MEHSEGNKNNFYLIRIMLGVIIFFVILYSFVHVVDDLEDDFTLHCGWRAEQQSDSQVGIPKLLLPHQKFAYLGQCQAINRSVGPDHDRDVSSLAGKSVR